MRKPLILTHFQRLLLLFLVGSIIHSCKSDRSPLLHGTWQAASLTEQGDSLAVNLADIGFVFKADGRYAYRSTLAYQESGHYRLTGKYLYSQDTTQRDAAEKAVEVLQLTPDSLQLRMLDAGQERRLLLLKQE
ncbi:MAG: hypothetical protein AAGJ82_12085 [Bacteroidota bacterium]